MSTKQNTIDIKPVDSKFSNLKDEILDIKSGISNAKQEIQDATTSLTNTNNDITEINNKITQINTDISNISLNADTVTEVVNARTGYVDLKSRLDYIESLDVFHEKINTSSIRDYIYDAEGNIIIEKIAGDLNYEIHYGYDSIGNITTETHYVGVDIVGTKTYEYDDKWNVTKVTSDNADILEVISSFGATKLLEDRVKALENLDIANELDSIKSTILTGPYDGKTLLDRVNAMTAKVENLENALSASTDILIDMPNIMSRLDALESEIFTGKKRETFVVQENIIKYALAYPTTVSKLRVYVDGIYLAPGTTEDYILLDDSKTIQFIVGLLTGSEIICEYY